VKAQTTADTAKENIKKTSDYALPYPGILPGNPLYGLKVFRDKVFEFLIIDSLKKSDFYLLQADKRLAAGNALIKKGEVVLGEQTISKAEKYFELAVNNFSLIKESSDLQRDLNNRLKRSAAKHEEIITYHINTGSESIRGGLNVSLFVINNIAKNLGLFEKDQERESTVSSSVR
jgi:hypothetical protein